jgi:uncharacterized protein (TIGR02271 family)
MSTDRDNPRPTAEPTEPGAGEEQQTTVPVIAEDLVTGTRKVKTGAVRVHKRVHERTERVEMPLIQDTVEIKRVVIDKVIDAPPHIRTVGDTTIVPVIEEQMIVTKRLVLKEEVHLIRRRTKRRVTREVTLQREEAHAERVDAEGKPLTARRTP